MGHGSWVMWVMGQLCDRSHGSWVMKDDPFPSVGVNGMKTAAVNGCMPGNHPPGRKMKTSYPGVKVKTCNQCDCELTAYVSSSTRRPALDSDSDIINLFAKAGCQ